MGFFFSLAQKWRRSMPCALAFLSVPTGLTCALPHDEVVSINLLRVLKMTRKALFAFLSLVACAFAQSERGAITGLVTDTTGAVVAGASVEIVSRATNIAVRVTSTTAGEYNAANLSPGDYKVQVSAAGFQRFP